jgi:hypothetical protein
MKKMIFISLVLTAFLACKDAPNSTDATKATEKADATKDTTAGPTTAGGTQNTTDTTSITEVVHGFYKWYETFPSMDYDYVDAKGKIAKLDNSKLEAYHTALLKSGFLSKAYIDNDMAYLKKYEAEWVKNKENGNDGPLSGLDYDRVFCGQDWDIVAYKSGAVKVDGISANEAKAGIESSKLDLVKENGKWLISKITCE